MVGTVIMVIAGVALFRNFGSIVLRLAAWVLAAKAVLSVFADIDVPGAAIVFAGGLAGRPWPVPSAQRLLAQSPSVAP